MRTGRKLSRKTVAESLDIAPNYLYMIESGLRIPSINLTLKVGHYFDVNPEWLKSMWVRDFVSVVEAKLQEHIEHIHYLP
jgi:transcriptional regulator with XRE-family HTH domain